MSTWMVARGVLLRRLRRLCTSCRRSADISAVVSAAAVAGLSRKRNPRATTRATKHVRIAAIAHYVELFCSLCCKQCAVRRGGRTSWPFIGARDRVATSMMAGLALPYCGRVKVFSGRMLRS